MDRFWIDHWFKILDESTRNKHYIGSINPLTILQEFSDALKNHIEDMEINEQIEADMTITHKGKTYLVNVKNIPALNMDEESQDDNKDESDSADE